MSNPILNRSGSESEIIIAVDARHEKSFSSLSSSNVLLSIKEASNTPLMVVTEIVSDGITTYDNYDNHVVFSSSDVEGVAGDGNVLPFFVDNAGGTGSGIGGGGGGSSFYPGADLVDDVNATYFYFGWESLNGGWLVRRQNRATSAVLNADVNNNPLVINLAAAWVDRETLVYS